MNYATLYPGSFHYVPRWHPCSQGFSAACVAVSPGTSQTRTPQILVFSRNKVAVAAAKNADYALIFTEKWRRVGEQKILDFSFVLMCFPPSREYVQTT
jgi:hypothetical protein